MSQYTLSCRKADARARLEKAETGEQLSRKEEGLLKHLRQVDSEEVGGQGGVANPISLALRDIGKEASSGPA